MKQAIQLIEKSSVIIFSENKLCEQATALTLLAKCNVAQVQHLSSSNIQKVNTLKAAINKLESAKSLYQKMECMAKVKDVVYLQVSKIFHRCDISASFCKDWVFAINRTQGCD